MTERDIAVTRGAVSSRSNKGQRLRFGQGSEEVGSYVTSLQFLLCQQYVHRRECMGKNKDVARTK